MQQQTTSLIPGGPNRDQAVLKFLSIILIVLEALRSHGLL
jgi:hypothetical protein